MWIEIPGYSWKGKGLWRHPPHGGCGLKSNVAVSKGRPEASHPPHGGCGLKCSSYNILQSILMSSSAWRMWIEIVLLTQNYLTKTVILRMEDVDWNIWMPLQTRLHRASSSAWRMWIEIHHCIKLIIRNSLSSSAWRMWIEIMMNVRAFVLLKVILRMEDVDWNL